MTTDVRRHRYQFDLAAWQRTAALNYAALRPLVRGITAQRPRLLKLGQHLRFAIEVLEQSRYTTDIRIAQQQLNVQLPGLTEAQLDVRLYHDAQLAEVLRSQGVGRLQVRYPQPNRRMFQRDEKFRVNQFLSEWIQALKRAGSAQEP